ncbi:MAG: transglutaminase-like domain-containing protein, partial [Nanoarchaeota archaeon]|nr:transglutaminase-like domain-containing protein [Nanoarchaeota archaeon]
MNKTLFILALILILPTVYADELWFYNSKYLVLDVDLSTSVTIKSFNSNPDIDFILANISFFPKQVLGQDILESDFEPEPKFLDDSVVFEWLNPGKQRLPITMRSKVKVKDDPITITRKMNFPFVDVPDEIKVFTQPAEIIDLNDDIINLASELASGKDDLIDVVDTIAFWVNTNIQYNFSTVNAEATQKASWVIENREGVCDELTSLFISMLRSLGIPARFVAGISYTDSPQFPEKWGPHGWAEVYFPGYGWVPYDVTYGEYGWIDPTHIFSKASEDAGKITSSYQWRAEPGVSLDLDDLDTNVAVIEIGPNRGADVSIIMDVLDDNIGFGSYNLITASVLNMRDYYVSKDVYLSQTNRITNLDETKKHILLRPGEVKEISWIIKVDEDLDKDYIYTFPFHAYTLQNASGDASFTSVNDAGEHSLDEIHQISSMIKEEESKAYSKNLKVDCSFEKEEYYQYDKPILQCFLTNTGNVFLKNMNICMKDDCRESHIGITQEKAMNFTIHGIKKGQNDVILSITNDQISKINTISFYGMDKPDMSIADIDFPSEVRFRDLFNVRFSAKKESDSEPQEVKVLISGARTDIEHYYPYIDKDIAYDLNLKGKDLNEGVNTLAITIEYKDKNGKD